MSNSLKSLTGHLNNWQAFKDILSSLRKGERIWIRGVYSTGLGFLLAGLKGKISNPILVVLADEDEARTLFADIKEFSPHTKIFYIPGCDFSTKISDGIYEDILNERITGIYNFLNSNSPLLVMSLKSFIRRMNSLSSFTSSVISLKIGENKKTELTERLEQLGYERKDIVEERGCWTLRGSILDVFAYFYDDPLRIEFLDEKIESIRHFDPTTQKSTVKLKEAVILPRGDVSEKRNSTILSYLPENSLVCLYNSTELEEQADKLWEGANIPGTAEYGNLAGTQFFTWTKMRKELSAKNIFFTSAIPQKPIGGYSKIFSLPFQSLALNRDYSGSGLEGIGADFNKLEGKVKQWQEENFNVYFVSYNEGEKERLEEILKEKKLYPKRNTHLKIGRVDCGFLISPLKTVVLTDKEIFSRYRFQRPFHKFKGGESISSVLDIKRGDYVVHLVHGIGRYLGLNEVKIGAVKKECLMLEYENRAILYVPIEGLELLHKYIGLEGKAPKLSHLGSSQWRHEKEKVSRACQDVAFELLNMEAIRKTKKGFAFSGDNQWQKEFEASFIYEETKDQLEASEQVKLDMGKSVPMDRLLCGDAGYGKTEVAVRAAFKAVMDDKQVAILVPTTILAQQHWLNFRDRVKDYPIRTEMLSRFQTHKEQSRIICDLKNGKVDIIIGTHRLLQKDVSFKQLGLVIIDEEQRFGVVHKERLKTLKKTVDVLTLSATPIPRTLYMTLSGIRELSMLNTPPRDRLAVKTIVAEFSKSLIKEAIENETLRSGQVFFLHNKIEDIEQVTDFVRSLLPEARIEFAHGQMHEKELEKIMLLFINKKIDVLVTTTIIESGLDIPNANTIIINDAHRFGLADLYQLRGRVGRYKLQAYAYLLLPPKEILTPEAKKRLRALEEFSHLGSGFQLAMQDLEIRGAGNILGSEQHGHIIKVGLELYMKTLKNAVGRLKGKKTAKQITPTIDLGISAYIPSTYISDEPTKISFYKRIAELEEEKELFEMREELKDRFGNLPLSAELLLNIVEIKINAKRAGIEYIAKKDNNILMRFPKGHNLRKKIQSVSEKYADKIFVTANEELALPVYPAHASMGGTRKSDADYGEYGKIVKSILALLQEFI